MGSMHTVIIQHPKAGVGISDLTVSWVLGSILVGVEWELSGS